MKKLIFLLLCQSALAGILTKDDLKSRGTCPPSLKSIKIVYKANLAGGGFKEYSVPKSEDPKDAAYREEIIAHIFYLKGQKIELARPIGDYLTTPFDSSTASDIVMLQPFELVVTDSDEKNWLISINRQDDYISIVPLKTLGDDPPLNMIYWAWLDDGHFEAGSRELKSFIWKYFEDAEQGAAANP